MTYAVSAKTWGIYSSMPHSLIGSMFLTMSPFHLGKRSQREKVLIERAKSNGVFIAYINMVGGQDELVFDGGSLIVGPTGNILMRANQFEEKTYIPECPTVTCNFLPLVVTL